MWTLYWRLIAARIRAQMQYKLSFLLEMLSFGLITATSFATIAILLNRFKVVGGWTVAEIALLYGLTSTALSLAEMIARGFDMPFEQMILNGTFDTVLTRPLGTFFQIFASEFQLRRLGRTLQGLAVLAFACTQLPIAWTPANLALVPMTIASGALIYISLTMIGATICFWTIKTPEVINIFTVGGEQMSSYPLNIYNSFLRTAFLWIVPIGFTNYPTALILLNRSDPHGLPAILGWAAPLVALSFFAVARAFWQIGVAKYSSTGS